MPVRYDSSFEFFHINHYYGLSHMCKARKQNIFAHPLPIFKSFTRIFLLISSHKIDIVYIIFPDCSRSNKEPKISCGDKNKLNIRWTTDVTFTADVMKAPLLLQRELEERILKQGLMLSITVITSKPL